MNNVIEQDTILKRVNGIQTEIVELDKLGGIDFGEFSKGDGFKLAQFHLHRALEGVFNISAHILSRLPGGQATTYKEIAIKLGEVGIIDKDFAGSKLVLMVKYRNRIVHFYADISEKEIYDIIQNNLDDFNFFLKVIKKVLEYPNRFGLEVE
jgi:uncharacterized protein YutE (UPF0331/DUF86 family)